MRETNDRFLASLSLYGPLQELLFSFLLAFGHYRQSSCQCRGQNTYRTPHTGVLFISGLRTNRLGVDKLSVTRLISFDITGPVGSRLQITICRALRYRIVGPGFDTGYGNDLAMFKLNGTTAGDGTGFTA